MKRSFFLFAFLASCLQLAAQNPLSNDIKREILHPVDRQFVHLFPYGLPILSNRLLLTTTGDIVPTKDPLLTAIVRSGNTSKWQMGINYRPTFDYWVPIAGIPNQRTAIFRNVINTKFRWKKLGLGLQFETLGTGTFSYYSRPFGPYLYTNAMPYILMDSGALVIPNTRIGGNILGTISLRW